MSCEVLIIGINGMLGNSLFKYFTERTDLKTFGLIRNKKRLNKSYKYFSSNKIYQINYMDYDQLKKILIDLSPKIIINCIGIVKQNPLSNNVLLSIQVNSLFPHILYKYSSKIHARLINFSTDCIFSGLKGNYKENDFADAQDLYGRTKFLGEISDSRAITLRTSFIGQEVSTNRALLNWFLSKSGTIKGYKNAIYSGLTTLEIGKVIHKFIIPNENIEGLYHLSSKKIDKFTLLSILKEQYKRTLTIEEDYNFKIDRSLDSEKFKKETGYQPLEWSKAVKEMKAFGIDTLC